MKLYLGCAMPPFHPQHLEIMGDPYEWVWIDKYIDHPNVQKWDVTTLQEVPDNCVEHIYASHLLEHLPQVKLAEVLTLWYSRLAQGGKLTLNVPDLVWACKQVVLYEGDLLLAEYYREWVGDHGLMNIFYGSQVHDGEYHKSGFCKSYLKQLLESVGYRHIFIRETEDAHDMGVLIAEAYK